MMGGASLMGTSQQSGGMPKRRWWTAGDLAGFPGLGLDNLIQILLMVALGMLSGLASWGLSAAAAANRE
jgi:hypothetical protein